MFITPPNPAASILTFVLPLCVFGALLVWGFFVRKRN